MESTRIHCTGCDYEYFEHYQPIEVRCQLEHGIVTYGKTKAWCHECNTIRYAENLPTCEEIRDDYSKIYKVPGPAVKGLRALLRRYDRQYHEKLAELTDKIAWREQRTTPPHCLECGSTNIVTLICRSISKTSVAVDNFRHSCGGELVHDYSDMPGYRFFFKKKVIWVDSEGNFVDGPAEG
jgi:hypothetical protein